MAGESHVLVIDTVYNVQTSTHYIKGREMFCYYPSIAWICSSLVVESLQPMYLLVGGNKFLTLGMN